jgi:hypothetical protein
MSLYTKPTILNLEELRRIISLYVLVAERRQYVRKPNKRPLFEFHRNDSIERRLYLQSSIASIPCSLSFANPSFIALTCSGECPCQIAISPTTLNGCFDR